MGAACEFSFEGPAQDCGAELSGGVKRDECAVFKERGDSGGGLG
jgi:hypothetical protein